MFPPVSGCQLSAHFVLDVDICAFVENISICFLDASPRRSRRRKLFCLCVVDVRSDRFIDRFDFDRCPGDALAVLRLMLRQLCYGGFVLLKAFVPVFADFCLVGKSRAVREYGYRRWLFGR